MPYEFSLKTRSRDDFADITSEVQKAVTQSGKQSGVATVFIPHTTAAVTIQENADPPLKIDITRSLDKIFPWTAGYKHGEDNAAAHLKTMTVGTSEQILFEDGRLILGTWQSVYFCEFDGPRRRSVLVHISG